MTYLIKTIVSELSSKLSIMWMKIKNIENSYFIEPLVD